MVRLGVDIPTLEYFVSKTMMANIDDNTHEDLNLEVEKMKERAFSCYSNLIQLFVQMKIRKPFCIVSADMFATVLLQTH